MDFSTIRKVQEALNQIKKFEDRFGSIHNLNLNKTLNDYHNRLNFPQISSLFGERQIEMQRVVDEMQQRNRAMTTIADSLSVFRGVKEKLSEISNSYFSINLSSSLANINKLVQEHLRIVNDTKTLSFQHNVLNPTIKSAMFAGSLRLSEIEALRNNTVNFLPNEQFRGVLSEFQKSINDARFFENIDVIRNSYFGNLAQTFRDVIESSENEEEVMEKMTSLVEEKLTESSNNKLLTQDTLKTIIALLSLIATLYFGFSNLANSKQASETQQLRYNQLLKAIEKIVENTNPTNGEIEVYYVVEREIDVRTKPNFKSVKFSRLYPNTKVKLIVEKHKWIYIEWTDYLEAIPRYGWINKKYLKRLQSQEIFKNKQSKAIDNQKEKETGLIKKVKEFVLSYSERIRFYELIEKRRDENISENELNELILLTEKSEELNVKRLKSLVEIAQIRNKTLREVMKELEIFPPQTI